ncbi:hypothetical protein NHX12_004252 [Muraenolepis orangiensis]|uniref:Uncharacterized protein n=1 Tax=Muraenolepis orangiensis TaxID=630683 RepID=A0A9Q0DYN9_9TELE|nr:hypothetical protein NHX12_004252 [Muraenolepis orangiensis]
MGRLFVSSVGQWADCLSPPSANGWSEELVGIPADVIEKGRDYKLVTEVTQSGEDFTWTQVYPGDTRLSNKFTVGTVSMQGGQLSVDFPNYHHTSEVCGGKLVERTSKKL